MTTPPDEMTMPEIKAGIDILLLIKCIRDAQPPIHSLLDFAETLINIPLQERKPSQIMMINGIISLAQGQEEMQNKSLAFATLVQNLRAIDTTTDIPALLDTITAIPTDEETTENV